MADVPYAVLTGGIFYPAGFRFDAKSAVSDALQNFQRNELGQLEVRDMPAFLDHKKPRVGRWLESHMDPSTGHAMSFGYVGPSTTPEGKAAVQGVLDGTYGSLSMSHRGEVQPLAAVMVEASAEALEIAKQKRLMRVSKTPLEISYVKEPARDGSSITYRRPVNRAQFESFLRYLNAGCKAQDAAHLAGATDHERLRRGLYLSASKSDWANVDRLVDQLILDAVGGQDYKTKLDNQTHIEPTATPSPFSLFSSSSFSRESFPQLENARNRLYREMQQQQAQLPAQPLAPAGLPAPALAASVAAPAAPAPVVAAPAAPVAPAQSVAAPAAATPAPAPGAPAQGLGLNSSMVQIASSVPNDVEKLRQVMLTMAETMDISDRRLAELTARNKEFEAEAARQREEKRKIVEQKKQEALQNKIFTEEELAQLGSVDQIVNQQDPSRFQSFLTTVECGARHKRKADQFEREVAQFTQAAGQGNTAAYKLYLEQAARGQEMSTQPVLQAPVQPAEPMNAIQMAMFKAFAMRPGGVSSPADRVANYDAYANARAGLPPPSPVQMAPPGSPAQMAPPGSPAQPPQQLQLAAAPAAAPAVAQTPIQAPVPQYQQPAYMGDFVKKTLGGAPNSMGTYQDLARSGIPASSIEYFVSSMHQGQQ